jgi:hypothetical protein
MLMDLVLKHALEDLFVLYWSKEDLPQNPCDEAIGLHMLDASNIEYIVESDDE